MGPREPRLGLFYPTSIAMLPMLFVSHVSKDLWGRGFMKVFGCAWVVFLARQEQRLGEGRLTCELDPQLPDFLMKRGSGGR